MDLTSSAPAKIGFAWGAVRFLFMKKLLLTVCLLAVAWCHYFFSSGGGSAIIYVALGILVVRVLLK